MNDNLKKSSGYLILDIRDRVIEKNKYPILDLDLGTAAQFGIEGLITEGAYIFKPLLIEEDNCIELHMLLFNGTFRLERKININSKLKDIIEQRNSMLGEAFEAMYPLWSIENPNKEYLTDFLNSIKKRNG